MSFRFIKKKEDISCNNKLDDDSTNSYFNGLKSGCDDLQLSDSYLMESSNDETTTHPSGNRQRIVRVLKKVNFSAEKISNGVLNKLPRCIATHGFPSSVFKSGANSSSSCVSKSNLISFISPEDSPVQTKSPLLPHSSLSPSLMLLPTSPSTLTSLIPLSSLPSSFIVSSPIFIQPLISIGQDQGPIGERITSLSRPIKSELAPLGLKVTSDLASVKCSKCSFQCYFEDQLRSHVVNKHEDDMLSCQCCNYICLQSFLLINHYKEFHPKCYCEECGFVTKHGYILKRHKQSHSEEGRWCAECDKLYKDRYVLKMHMKMVHTTVEKLFKCDICSKEFNRKAHLKRHMRIHDPDKPFKCPHQGCSYRGCEKSDINKHSLIHNEPKYACNICNRLFRHVKNRDLHSKRHTGEKDYKCGVCNFFGYTFTDIRKHIERKHTKHGLFTCDRCSQVFSTENEDHKCPGAAEEEFVDDEDGDDCSGNISQMMDDGGKMQEDKKARQIFHVVNITQVGCLEDAPFPEDNLYEIHMPKSELTFSDDDC